MVWASDPRWVGTGRTVFDNKGNAVKQYEPYFSSTDAYESEEELREQGVTPLLHYDPLGRLIRTEYPDGTESRVEFSPWHVEHWDRNDTAGASAWYSTRIGLPVGDLERVAAESTDDHHDTPMVTRFDAQGRPMVSVADLGGGTTYLTRVELDIEGNVLSVTDARDNTAQTSVHGMLGQVLETDSVDAGQRRSMVDVMGTPLRAFDDPALSRVHRWEYDALRRPTQHRVQPSTGSEVLVTRTVYGETATSPQTNNLRGRTLRVYDGAGLLESVAFDFAGNLLEQERTLMEAHDVVPDWVTLANETTLSGLDTAAASLLDTEVFTTEGTFDAFGRPVTRTTPDGSVTRYGYNDAGLLESVSADVRGATPATDFVDNIDYDVHGRRALIEYANGTNTTYEYDPLSFRLMRVTTERDSDSAVMQDLQYVYDAVGNITSITDGAQQTLYFDNAVVTPDQTFEYDALYRLVEATGREHTSQGQPTESELTPGAQPEASDPAALRTYTESYTYDEVGNLTLVEHVATGGNWSRGYHYATDGNRLLSTSLPGDTVGTPATYSASYTHDDHGNMTAMPHLAAIDWDYAQRMQHADLGGGGDVWFQYDAAGNRVRKVQVNSAGTAANERIYLGGVEVYRQRDVVSGSLDAVNDERETLHISDDAGRIAMVETLTIDGGTVVSSPANVARYQYGNHLGTVALELDDSAAVISYEEFHPYGGSAYRAVDSTIAVSAKRYRYAGLERDEETGLDHMGARYYAGWLGRWTAADPIGLGDGVNRYRYARGNPVTLTDPNGTRAGPPGSQDAALQIIEDAAQKTIPYGQTNPEGTQTLFTDQGDVVAPVTPEAIENIRQEHAGAVARHYDGIAKTAIRARGAEQRAERFAAHRRSQAKFTGALQVGQGLLEIGGGLLGVLAPEPSTTAGGVVLTAHGTDLLTTGIANLGADEAMPTLVQGVAHTGVSAIGLQGAEADIAVTAIDAGVSIGAAVRATPSTSVGGTRVAGASADGPLPGTPGTRTFAHGAPAAHIDSIVSSGLSETAARAAAGRGAYQRGSFFTLEVPPNSNVELAFDFGVRHTSAGEMPQVLLTTLPEKLFDDLVAQGANVVEQSTIPNLTEVQTVFKPPAFGAINDAVSSGAASRTVIKLR